jgi:hypothetical protein
MTFRRYARVLCAAVALSLAAGVAANAQSKQPTPAAMLLAKELIELKGASTAYDPLVAGVIEYHKNLFMQTNPNLAKDLDAVAAKLLKEMEPRKIEMHQALTRIYATHFSEQELKDILAFYRSPIGKKLIAEEPKAMEESMKTADDWSKKFAEEIAAKFRSEMRARGHNMI